MNIRIRPFAIAAVALSMALAGGCSSGEAAQPTSGNGAPAALEKVRFLTGLSVQGRESYIFVAIEKGYFKEAGLEVEVTPGNGTTQNLQVLQSGTADFAVIDITAAFIEYGKGTFKDFTIVSAIQQRNLACFMALEGSGISRPKDLEDKKVAYIPGGVVKLLFDAYADLAGVNKTKVQWVNMPAQQMGQGLAAGSIDAATQFVVGQPGIEAAAKGKKVVVLPFSEYLTDLYGNGLGVSKKSMQEKPDRVKKFNQAMLKGLAYAIANPAEAGEIYAKYQKIQTKEVAAAETALMVPYVNPGGGAPIGTIDPLRAARNIAILQGVGVIPSVINAQDVVSFDLVPKA